MVVGNVMMMKLSNGHEMPALGLGTWLVDLICPLFL